MAYNIMVDGKENSSDNFTNNEFTLPETDNKENNERKSYDKDFKQYYTKNTDKSRTNHSSLKFEDDVENRPAKDKSKDKKFEDTSPATHLPSGGRRNEVAFEVKENVNDNLGNLNLGFNIYNLDVHHFLPLLLNDSYPTPNLDEIIGAVREQTIRLYTNHDSYRAISVLYLKNKLSTLDRTWAILALKALGAPIASAPFLYIYEKSNVQIDGADMKLALALEYSSSAIPSSILRHFSVKHRGVCAAEVISDVLSLLELYVRFMRSTIYGMEYAWKCYIGYQYRAGAGFKEPAFKLDVQNVSYKFRHAANFRSQSHSLVREGQAIHARHENLPPTIGIKSFLASEKNHIDLVVKYASIGTPVIPFLDDSETIFKIKNLEDISLAMGDCLAAAYRSALSERSIFGEKGYFIQNKNVFDEILTQRYSSSFDKFTGTVMDDIKDTKFDKHFISSDEDMAFVCDDETNGQTTITWSVDLAEGTIFKKFRRNLLQAPIDFDLDKKKIKLADINTTYFIMTKQYENSYPVTAFFKFFEDEIEFFCQRCHIVTLASFVHAFINDHLDKFSHCFEIYSIGSRKGSRSHDFAREKKLVNMAASIIAVIFSFVDRKSAIYFYLRIINSLTLVTSHQLVPNFFQA